MCLTGVDYLSSLGYAPGIAALAAGLLSPLATLILVLVTLGGALPMYRRVAREIPHGDGSVSMLERLLPWWQGKLFVLGLLGFVATGFVITITLSAADAAAHIGENPFTQPLHGHEIVVTLLLIALLGAVFLKGFSEAIGIAVALVGTYLALNLVVVGAGLAEIVRHPHAVIAWQGLLAHTYGSPLAMLGLAIILFPKLALGLSGFETGVLVMPLVRGDPADDPGHPAGRIRNGRRLLTAAAAIMSLFLFTSSIVTTLLIPQAAFREGGPASGRALAYLAHRLLGDGFGSLYDLSTIGILWFAGASAMAGLLNIVPPCASSYGIQGWIKQELMGIGRLFAPVEAAAGGQTTVNEGDGAGEEHRAGEGAGQMEGVGADSLRGFGQRAGRIGPAAGEQEPVLDDHGQEFGTDLAQHPPVVRAAGGVNLAVTLPQLEQQFHLPARPQEHEGLVQG